MGCEARQEGDEMACACGLRWGVDELNPPHCRRQRHAAPVPSSKRELLSGARRELNFIFASGDKDAGFASTDDRRYVGAVLTEIPADLSAHVAGRMVAAYERAIDAGASNQKAMRAAYRVFLDSLPS